MVASLASLEQAKFELGKLKNSKPDSLNFEIFEAFDRNANTMWAVTIKSDATIEEAKSLVCLARTDWGFRKDTYMWANEQWTLAYPTKP